MQQVVSKPLSFFKPDPDQPRKVFDGAELRLLASTLVVRQIVPILAKPCGVVIDGERRLRAALLGGRPDKLDAIIVTETLTAAQQQDMQLITSLQRASLNHFEQFVAFTRWFELNDGATSKELAHRIGRDPSMLTRIMSLSGGVAEVKKAAAEGLLSATEWYPICRLEPQDQIGLLNLRLGGNISRDEMNRKGRQTRRRSNGSAAPAAGAAQVKRLPCVLPNGIAVKFTGENITLETAIEAMKELTIELRHALSQGLDAKTVIRVLADKGAKKGG
jgi:ParB/RepB/Spo0J family partition protein